MFHKRLLKEYKDLNFYVVKIVVSQWLLLISNIIMMAALAMFIGNMITGNAGHKEAGIYTAIIALAVIIRTVAIKVNSANSVLVSSIVKNRLRKSIFQKLLRLGKDYHDGMNTSEVVQFTTEGVEQLEIYYGKYIPQFFYSMVAPVMLFLITSFISIKIAIVLLVCVPLIQVSIIIVQKFAKKMLAKYWGTYTQMGDSFLECLQGLTTLKIYNADKFYAEKMDDEAENFRKVTMKVLVMQLNSISIMDLVAYGGAGLGIIISILEVYAGMLSISQGFFVIMIAAEYFLPMRLLGSFFHIAMNGNAAADKIFTLLDAPEDKEKTVKDGIVIERNEHEICEVRFSNVSFSYEEKQVLYDISLELHKGMTALVGKSGCGKSTIVSLISNYPDVVKIGHNAYIFAGTIRSNLLMGCEHVSEEELFEVLHQVNMLTFVKEKGGLDYEIKENGSNLSGGQKQRLAVARALLCKASIYIFDESTSNVDADSENDIMKVIMELARERIVLFISHRLDNVVQADCIYVCDAGNITEQGKHRDLMKKKSTYFTMYEAQLQLGNYSKREVTCES